MWEESGEFAKVIDPLFHRECDFLVLTCWISVQYPDTDRWWKTRAGHVQPAHAGFKCKLHVSSVHVHGMHPFCLSPISIPSHGDDQTLGARVCFTQLPKIFPCTVTRSRQRNSCSRDRRNNFSENTRSKHQQINRYGVCAKRFYSHHQLSIPGTTEPIISPIAIPVFKRTQPEKWLFWCLDLVSLQKQPRTAHTMTEQCHGRVCTLWDSLL